MLANFSYAKLPMVKDLEVAEELLLDSELLCAIAGDPASIEELRSAHGDVAANAPDFTPPSDEFLVVDADSSQSYAINSIVAGHDLVIEGPPGTGKSQTIANLIATLSARGKRVLFVAEKRAAIDAVLDRLRDVGLADLVLDMHDGPGAKRKLAQELKKSLDDISTARALDYECRARATGPSPRRAGCPRTEALHRKDPRWGISPYELQCELIGIPESSKSEQRFGSVALTALDAEAYRRAQESLEQFIAVGGFSIATSDNPWQAALDAGTITTPEQAAAVAEAMTNFTQHTLPEATARIEATLGSVGLRRPETVADWARTIELLHRTQETLAVFTPAAFELDLSGHRHRAGAGRRRRVRPLLASALRRLLPQRTARSTRAASVDPKAKGPALLAGLAVGPRAARRLARRRHSTAAFPVSPRASSWRRALSGSSPPS